MSERNTGVSQPLETRVAKGARTSAHLRVFQHSNVFYWWPVWVWGYVCAALTFVQGVGIKELATSSEKVILFHPAPWLGWSFIGVVLAVVYFSNVRARGIYSFAVVFLMALIGFGLPFVPGMDQVKEVLPLLRIHLNLAFYLTFSSLLMIQWFAVVGLVDHLTWVRFSPGQVAEEHLFGQAVAHTYSSEGMTVRRLPDDLIRNKILGLRWLGQGTGDFLFRPAHGEPFELHNVWRASRKQPEIERLIATKITESRSNI